MTEIQGGRWDGLLKRMFPVKGQAVAPAIGPEIIPTMTVEPYTLRHRILAGERTYGSWNTLGAVENEYGLAMLHNPPDSGCMVEVIEAYAVAGFGIPLLFAWFGSNVCSTRTNTYSLDSREGEHTAQQYHSVAQFWVGTDPFGPAADIYAINGNSDINQTVKYTHGAVIKPGAYFYMRTGLHNIALNYCGFIWREYSPSTGEVNLGYPG